MVKIINPAVTVKEPQKIFAGRTSNTYNFAGKIATNYVSLPFSDVASSLSASSGGLSSLGGGIVGVSAVELSDSLDFVLVSLLVFASKI